MSAQRSLSKANSTPAAATLSDVAPAEVRGLIIEAQHRRCRRQIYRRFKIMTAVSLAVLSLLLYIDVAKAMVVFVGPMVLAIFNVARLGYDQHAGLEMEDHFSASRNIENRLYNRITFNSGYHTAHHVRPGLHWSRLPELHRQLHDRIPAELRA